MRLVSVLSLVVIAACSSAESSRPGKTSPESNERADEESGERTAGDTAPPPSKVNTTTETIDVDGTPRSFVLSVPKSYDATRTYPLILALHGDGGDGAGFRQGIGLETQTGEDAILAYPDHSEDLFTPYWENVDQRMLEVIIDDLKVRYAIDASKVWGFGYSKGAYQLNEIACKRPGLFTAMAIHAGGAPQSRDDEGNVACPEAAGIATFVTHGELDDPMGGEFAAKYWAETAGCDGTREASTPAYCQSYANCPAAEPVVFCLLANQDHGLYGNAARDSWAWFTSL